MSNSFNPLQAIQVIDPITDIHATKSYAVLSGGDAVSFKNYPASAISATSVTFGNANPPAGGFITDRNVAFTLPVRLTFTGNIKTTNSSFAPSSTLLNIGKDCPRSFPINSSIQTTTVQINNETVTIPSSDIFQPLARYNIDTNMKVKDYSGTPTYPDMSFNYSDLDGTPNNPLASYANTPNGACIPRGAWPCVFINNNPVTPTTSGTAATASCDFYTTESIFLSPFYFGAIAQDSQGFYNVQTMNFNFNFLNQAGSRLWSHNKLIATSGAIQVTSNITAITVQFNNFASPAFSFPINQPGLQFRYITPALLTKERLGPLQSLTYPYWKVDEYVTDLATPLTFGVGPSVFNSTTVQIPTIPRYMYLFARPSQSALLADCSLTDTYLAINSVSIQFANNPSLLASASQYQLWLLNCKNGGTQDYASWCGLSQCNTVNATVTGIGSILCLEFGTDIQMGDPTLAPGVAGNFQLQIQVYLQNMNASGAWDNVPMSIYILTQTEGSFSVPSLGSANIQQSVLTAADVLDAQQKPSVSYSSIAHAYGGDFWSSLSNFGNKINNFLKETKLASTIGKVAGTVIPGVGTAANIADALGYGGSRGGRYTTRDEIRSRLR